MIGRAQAIFVQILLAPIFALAAGAAELLIIASDVAGLDPGTRISALDRISVPADGRVTLIGEGGEPINLIGPYSGMPANQSAKKSKPGLFDALARLVTSPSTDISDFGASKEIGGGASQVTEGRGRTIWMINVARSGPHCLPAGAPVFLWRSEPRREAELSIRRTTAAKASSMTWPKGNAVIGWPVDLVIADGATYRVQQSGAEGAKDITLKIVPTGFENSARLAAWMADARCADQALAVLSGLLNIGTEMELELTTEKGPEPKYRIGDEVKFQLQANQDAYVNCFYRQADGTLIKIIPNRYVPKVRILAGFPHQFPDERMPFKLALSRPLGVETITCFATDREVAEHLPKEIRSLDLAPLHGISENKLHKFFQSIPNVKIVLADVHFTVVAE